MSNEKYPDGWVNLNMMLNEKTHEIHYIGGDRESDNGTDSPFKGEKLLQDIKNNQPIYTITTIRYDTERCVGYVYDLEKAKNIIEQNECDINEAGYYPYAVIEEVRQGLYNVERKEFWYNWSVQFMKYKPISKPDKYQRNVCFSMG